MAALTAIAGRLRRSEKGAELIEFAIAFPLLLLVVLGIFDFGLMFQQYEVITNAAREGARIAVLPNYTAADAEARVTQYIDASFLSSGGTPTIAVGAPQEVAIGGNCMATVTVSVSYPHTYIFLGGSTGGIAAYFGKTFMTKTLHASSTMRVETAAAGCP